MAASRELPAEIANVGGEVALVSLPRQGADVRDREPWRGHAAIIAPTVKPPAPARGARRSSTVARGVSRGRPPRAWPAARAWWPSAWAPPPPPPRRPRG